MWEYISNIITVIFSGTPNEVLFKVICFVVVILIIGFFAVKLKINKQTKQIQQKQQIGNNSNNNLQIGRDYQKDK